MKGFRDFVESREILRVFPKRSIESWIERHGLEMTVAPAKNPGLPKQCFANAFRAVMKERALTYVEGIVLAPVPILHAWVADNNGAYEVTLSRNEGFEYIGVPIKHDFLLKVALQTGEYGVFSAWGKNGIARQIIDGEIAPEDVIDENLRARKLSP
jgi:hypothetical protein